MVQICCIQKCFVCLESEDVMCVKLSIYHAPIHNHPRRMSTRIESVLPVKKPLMLKPILQPLFKIMQ